MARYDAYLFLHVVCAIVWLGGGLMLTVQAFRASRVHDSQGLERVLADGEALGNRLFIPSSLLVLVFGILMVADGPWQFSQLWIALGLAGYAVTFATGILVMKPGVERVHALIERHGGMSPTAAAETERLLVKGRADLVVLYLVVAVMVIKPTGADVAVLGAMAAILVGALTWVVLRAQAVQIPAEPIVAGGSLPAADGDRLGISGR